MEVYILAALLGLIPAMIAQKKGRSFGLWWFYGAMLFIIALPHSLIISADAKTVERQQLEEGMKKCPYCAEMIKAEAKVCRYCGRELTEVSQTSEKKHMMHTSKHTSFKYEPSHKDET